MKPSEKVSEKPGPIQVPHNYLNMQVTWVILNLSSNAATMNW